MKCYELNIAVLFVFTMALPSKGEATEYLHKQTKSHSIDDNQKGMAYYIDADNGSDTNNGKTENKPLKTIAKTQQIKLNAGDTLKFKRGSEFIGPLYIRDSGTEEAMIVITAYGDKKLHAPKFTNTVFKEGNFGNCIRITGSFVKVEGLYFHSTPVYTKGNYTHGGGFLTMWEMGAVYVDKTAENCIIRKNEIFDCPVGIKSYGKHTLIEQNFIHDCNRVLKEWNWGPIGIWFGADYQEARYNKIFNYRAENPNITWGDGGGGADGSAFEIDDARYDKSNIAIHHNYTKDCQGFLEVTWTDVKQNPVYTNFKIHHNISDDYQQFVAIWAGQKFNIDNNTIIRRKKNASDWGVFNIAQDNSFNRIRNNIIVTEKDIPIFNVGLDKDHVPKSIIKNNLYFAASGKLVMGKEGPGEDAVLGDPLFVKYSEKSEPKDFYLREGSPAIGKASPMGYRIDYMRNKVDVDGAQNIGALANKK